MSRYGHPIHSHRDEAVQLPRIQTLAPYNPHQNQQQQHNQPQHQHYPIGGFDYAHNIHQENIPKPKNKMSTQQLFKIFIAELLGSAILMYIGCFACNGVSFGLGIIAAVQICAHLSGAHFNPSVTIAALIMKQIDFRQAGVYFAAEFTGTIVGTSILFLTAFSPDAFGTPYCVTTVNIIRITEIQAIFIEAIATGILILAVCSFWDAKNKTNSETISLKIGFVIMGLIYTSASYTGASFNVARTFATALLGNYWDYQYIYWVGPNLGAAIAAALYRFVLLKRPWDQ